MDGSCQNIHYNAHARAHEIFVQKRHYFGRAGIGGKHEKGILEEEDQEGLYRGRNL